MEEMLSYTPLCRVIEIYNTIRSQGGNQGKSIEELGDAFMFVTSLVGCVGDML